MVVHMVMFRFKQGNKEENFKKIRDELSRLPKIIPELKSIEVGLDFSNSERSFDMSIYATFDSKEDMQFYAVHPEHVKVVELIKSVTIESKIVDYIKE